MEYTASPPSSRDKPFPYQPEAEKLAAEVQSIQETIKASPQSHQAQAKRADALLQELHSYIVLMQVEQKSMPPSQRKKSFKTMVTELNARYRQIEIRQHHIKSLIILEDDCEMEFEETRLSGEEERLVARKGLRKADKEVKRQGERLKDSVALGHET